MKRVVPLLLLAGFALQAQDILGDRIRAHVQFLASDLLEGRAPGTRGGQLATEYLATEFALIGARPAGETGAISRRCRWWASRRKPARN